MALLDELGGLLNNVLSGGLNEQQTHDHYDQIAQAVPQQTLGSVIGPALGSLGTSEVLQRVENSATQMSPDQRGGLVQALLSGLGSSGLNIGSLLGQLGVDPTVASNPQSATPGEIAKLAAHAQSTNPGIFQEAMSFYSQHPTLVKALGTVVIAKIASQLSQGMH